MMNESDLGGRIAVVTDGACDIELPKPQRHQCSRRNSRSEDASNCISILPMRRPLSITVCRVSRWPKTVARRQRSTARWRPRSIAASPFRSG